MSTVIINGHRTDQYYIAREENQGHVNGLVQKGSLQSETKGEGFTVREESAANTVAQKLLQEAHIGAVMITKEQGNAFAAKYNVQAYNIVTKTTIRDLDVQEVRPESNESSIYEAAFYRGKDHVSDSPVKRRLRQRTPEENMAVVPASELQAHARDTLHFDIAAAVLLAKEFFEVDKENNYGLAPQKELIMKSELKKRGLSPEDPEVRRVYGVTKVVSENTPTFLANTKKRTITDLLND